MIQLKNKSELERMKKACQISAQALVVAGEHIRAGMTTLELDRILHHFIVSLSLIHISEPTRRS